MITKEKFEEAYQMIVNESKPILEMYQKKAIQDNVRTIAIVGGTLLCGILLSILVRVPIFLPIAIIMIIIYIGKKILSKKPSAKTKYAKEYKERVIHKLLQFFDENLEYTPTGGINSGTYYAAGFQTYDRYHMEDFIRGNIEEKYPFSMSELLIQSESTDSEGHTSYTTEFRGLFAMVENDKNTRATIYIKGDQKFGKKSSFRGTKLVPLDSLEFEKTFDVYSNNSIVTVQIMTSEIMQMLNEMHQQMKFEVSIIENKVFMRFPLKENLFEANYKKEIINKKKLYQYCQIINYVMELFLKIHNAIEEAQV